MSYDLEAVIKAYPDSKSCDETKGPTDKDGNFFAPDQAKVDAARVELNKLKYKDQRKFEYPSVAEQLDLIYHDIDNWKAVIKQTKDKYPKS